MDFRRFLGSRLLGSVSAVLAIGALASLTPACAAESSGGDTGEADDTSAKGGLELVVTVDWEGRDLNDANLRAMQDLHAKFPQVKIIHFLNAGYYTKLGADPADVTAKINSAIAPGDEKGLHIHGWKRLFEAAGAKFIASPTFWGTALSPQQCFDDCGHEVPISLYSTDELRKVVKFSLDTLEKNGFGRAKAFRCGGWMAKQSVRDAVALEGLEQEHSAVPTQFLQPKLGGYPVYDWLSDLWAGTTPTSQPYTMPAQGHDLLEVPDNGALSDYMSADQMVDVFEQNVAAWKADKKKKVVVSVGFHEETAATYLPILETALTKFYAEAEADRLPLKSVTSEALTAAPVSAPAPAPAPAAPPASP